MRCELPAGHAAALLSDALYIVGGGNNSAGCADLMCLDLGGLATGQPLSWSSVAKAEPRSAIASEGPPCCLPSTIPCTAGHFTAQGRRLCPVHLDEDGCVAWTGGSQWDSLLPGSFPPFCQTLSCYDHALVGSI